MPESSKPPAASPESLDVNRRLTCILAADAVGYSRLMSQDEAGTIRVLNAHRTVIDSIIAFHGGRIVGTAGDSVLAEFASAVAAVRCATEMQEALKTQNDALPEEKRLLFRIGVNLGDVVVKGADILGDGVNVAARLESIAEPGGVCIASSVYDQITGKLDLGFVDMGEQSLKNISRPIRAYQIGGARAAIPLAIAQAIAPPVVPEPPRRSPWLAISLGFVALSLVVAAIVAGVAWDRSRATAPVAQAIAPPPAPQVSKAPVAAPVAPVAPSKTEAAGPATDPTFAALAAGEAIPATPATGTASPARYDGEWLATFSCARYRDIPAGTITARATARDGVFVMEPGRGQQTYWHVSGRPARDSSLVLTGQFMTPEGARRGQDGNARFDGRLVGERFVLDGHFGPRSCSMTIARAGR